jgi:glycosyltransferase involved in cell wall biosynthesis
MAQALQGAGADLVRLHPVWQWPTRTLMFGGKVARRITGVDPMLNRTEVIARLKARALMRQLRQQPADAIFAPAGSTLIPELPAGIPVIYTSDATLVLMRKYYGRYAAPDWISDRTIELERKALHRANLLVYPTEWAADSAINHYGVDPARVLVQPFGANLADPPSRAEAIAPRREGPLRLLFCGVEWERKGGDVALQAVNHLRQTGISATLSIVGCRPPPSAEITEMTQCGAVTVIPFLNKSVPAERARFRALFLDADVLILPTRAECYGMVFCEAAACGTISVATATGGIPEVIQDGRTGYVLPEGSTGKAYASLLAALASDPQRLAHMKTAARAYFETKLNWEVWGRAVLDRFSALAKVET